MVRIYRNERLNSEVNETPYGDPNQNDGELFKNFGHYLIVRGTFCPP